MAATENAVAPPETHEPAGVPPQPAAGARPRQESDESLSLGDDKPLMLSKSFEGMLEGVVTDSGLTLSDAVRRLGAELNGEDPLLGPPPLAEREHISSSASVDGVTSSPLLTPPSGPSSSSEAGPSSPLAERRSIPAGTLTSSSASSSENTGGEPRAHAPAAMIAQQLLNSIGRSGEGEAPQPHQGAPATLGAAPSAARQSSAASATGAPLGAAPFPAAPVPPQFQQFLSAATRGGPPTWEAAAAAAAAAGLDGGRVKLGGVPACGSFAAGLGSLGGIFGPGGGAGGAAGLGACPLPFAALQQELSCLASASRSLGYGQHVPLQQLEASAAAGAVPRLPSYYATAKVEIGRDGAPGAAPCPADAPPAVRGARVVAGEFAAGALGGGAAPLPPSFLLGLGMAPPLPAGHDAAEAERLLHPAVRLGLPAGPSSFFPHQLPSGEALRAALCGGLGVSFGAASVAAGAVGAATSALPERHAAPLVRLSQPARLDGLAREAAAAADAAAAAQAAANSRGARITDSAVTVTDMKDCANMAAAAAAAAASRLMHAEAQACSLARGNTKSVTVNRKAWSMEEDATIRACVQRMGMRWRLIAPHLPGRSDDSVRNRWKRLREEDEEAEAAAAGRPRVERPPPPPPTSTRRTSGGQGAAGGGGGASRGGAVAASTIRSRAGDDGSGDEEGGDGTRQRMSWSAEEDEVIVTAVRELGPRWCAVAARLPSRTDQAIRNRWNRLQQRARVQARQAHNMQAMMHSAAGLVGGIGQPGLHT